MRAAVLVCLLLVVPTAIVHAQPAAEDEHKAKDAAKHLRQGRELTAAAFYDAAIREFIASYALVPVPEVQFRIGFAYDAKGDKPNALRAYTAFLAVVSEGPLADHARARVAKLSIPSEQRSEEPKRSWQRIIDRPLTLEGGRIGVDAGLEREGGWYRPRGQMNGTWEFGTRGRLGVGYGLNDRVTLAGEYSGGTRNVARHDPSTGVLYLDQAADRGRVTAYGAVRLVHTPSYSVATNLLVIEDIEDNEQGVGLGITARYRFSRRLAVFTGNAPIAPTYSNKVFWGFNEDRPSFSAAVGLEFQWTSRLFVQLTTVASYRFSPTTRHVISSSLATFVTVSEHLDLGASLQPQSFGIDARVFY